MHCLGQYPDDWKGKTFEYPIIAWVGGDTNQTVRDVIQAKLFGEPGSPGTGFIPEDCIGQIIPSRNISGGYDTVLIKHVSGGWSTIVFKSYQQGRDKWQGKGVHVLLLDEEPPLDIWGEAIARITATDGMLMLTFTPLKGLSGVVRGFYPHVDSQEKFMVRMELNEAMHDDGRSHLTAEKRKLMETRYPIHQRDARLRGLPILGDGLVYPVDENNILEPIVEEYGRHWRHIIGLDLGGDTSPTAFVHLALDPTTEVWHLLHVYSRVHAEIPIHASALMASKGGRINVAWPHDAMIKDRMAGITYANMYRQQGVRMLRDWAQFGPEMGGGNSVEPGVSMILSLMMEGRFKASLIHGKFWDEIRTYHRVNGVIRKEEDHVMDAIRYGIMMARFARPLRRDSLPTRTQEVYDPLRPGQLGKLRRGLPTRMN